MGLPTGTRGKLLLLVGAMLALMGSACLSQGIAVDPLEQRAQALEKSIMCPICPGESLDQSQVELAGQMRDILREKLAEGWTDQQVREFFVERYGPSVLMEPPREGFHLLAWVLPPVGVVGAVVALFLVLRHLLPTTPGARPDVLEGLSDEERQEYLRRAEAALAEDVGRGPVDTRETKD